MPAQATETVHQQSSARATGMLSGLINPNYNLFRPAYWLGDVDSRPVALFRIVFALLLLKDAIYHLPLARIYYSDAGIVPRAALWDGLARTNRISLMDAISAPWMATVFFVLWIVVLLGLLVGWRTRLMAILNFVILLSVQERNIYLLNGADTVFRVMSFWAIFLPMGQAFSVDALRRRAARYQLTQHPADLRPPSGPRPGSAFPVRMAQIQLALVYVFTGILKLPGEPTAWSRGEALHYALQLQSLTQVTGDWLVNSGLDWLLRYINYLTLFTEMAFVILVFLPILQPMLRMLGLTLGVLLHTGIALTMSIANFSMVMMGSYLLFFEWSWLDGLARWLHRLPAEIRSQLPLPQVGSPLWALLALTPSDALVLDTDVTQSVDEVDKWIIVDEQSNVLTGVDAWLRAAGYLPLSRLWAWMLRARFVRQLMWAALGAWARHELPVTLAPVEKEQGAPVYRSPNLALRALAALPLAALMAVIVWWNLATVERNGQQLVANVQDVPREVIQYAGLWQGWNMFAPYPTTVDGWIVIPGVFEDGTMLDLRTGEPVSEKMTRYFFGPQMRWKKYESNLSRGDYDPLLSAWGSYYCHLYNMDMDLPEGERLATLEIHFRFRRSHAPGEPPNPWEERLLWKHWCYPEYQY
jgi:hypothetical protein